MITSHRINDQGTAIMCESSPDAHCRQSPDCDTETWDSGGCHDHEFDTHPVLNGRPCWYVNNWISPVGLEDTHEQWTSADPVIRPGAAVDIQFHATDEGCTWTYAPIGPDCRDNKHPACDARALDAETDDIVDCACTCHNARHTDPRAQVELKNALDGQIGFTE